MIPITMTFSDRIVDGVNNGDYNLDNLITLRDTGLDGMVSDAIIPFDQNDKAVVLPIIEAKIAELEAAQ